MNHGEIAVSVEHFLKHVLQDEDVFFFTRWAPTGYRWGYNPYKAGLQHQLPISKAFFLGQISRWKDQRTLGGLLVVSVIHIHWFYVRGPWGYCVVCTKLIFSDMWNMVSLGYLHLLYWKIYATTFPLLAQINHQKKTSHEESITVISKTEKKTHHFRPKKTVLPKTGTPRPGVFPGFFCFRPVFSEWLERTRSERHEVFHVDALHVHLWRIKLDGSHRSIDEYWCLCCLMMAGWVRGFQP